MTIGDDDRLQPLRAGEPAPDFTLPLVSGEGHVALADYRGRTAVLLALFRGLHCSFCRQHIARLGLTRDRLLTVGVDVLAVTATVPERARRYLASRPVKVPVAADPDQRTHRRYGLPTPVEAGMSPEGLQDWLTQKYRALAEAHGATVPPTLPFGDLFETANRLDGYEMTETDRGRRDLLTGQFLIDRAGIVRWTSIEEASASGLSGFPSESTLLSVAGRLAAA